MGFFGFALQIQSLSGLPPPRYFSRPNNFWGENLFFFFTFFRFFSLEKKIKGFFSPKTIFFTDHNFFFWRIYFFFSPAFFFPQNPIFHGYVAIITTTIAISQLLLSQRLSCLSGLREFRRLGRLSRIGRLGRLSRLRRFKKPQ